jgi:hypothetical protein
MEQEALWYMLQANSSYGFLMNADTVTLVNERQFTSQWNSLNDLWLAHIPTYQTFRVVYFKTMLKSIGLMDQNLFKISIQQINNDSHLVVDILAVAEEMELRHLKNGLPKRSKYPTHYLEGSSEEWIFHNTNSATFKTKKSDHDQKTMQSLGYRYEGMVMTIKGQRDIWLIVNGTRRAFPNLNEFKNMGYKSDMIMTFQEEDPENKIPIGTLISDVTPTINFLTKV